ncbi:MAG: adenylyl-sulfate kinase [Proteobacteria bacterium]|nr:adenylyl-sulfate kinase [Pseudomonadota bacterium]
MQTENRNIKWLDTSVSREQRESLNGHRGAVLWFTGLSGSGKSTLSNAVEQRLYEFGYRTFLLDGDNIRHGLCKDLGFSHEDRTENIRRIGEVAKLFVDAGVVVLAAFISPYRSDREIVRSIMRPGDFNEVYCQCPLEVCEQRDLKGLYKKARAGEISNFTGISAPYEAPLAPEVAVNTAEDNLGTCVERVLAMGNLSRLPCAGAVAKAGN